MSRFHLEGGGDLVWNVGTGYFGCGTDRYGTHWMISVTPEDPLDPTADA